MKLNASVFTNVTWMVSEGISDAEKESIDKTLKDADSIVNLPKWVDKYKVNMVKNLRCYENVREMVLNGTPKMEIARQIHLYGEWDHLALSTIEHYLEHFKASIPKVLLVQRTANYHYSKAIKKIEDTVDVLNSMERLYTLMEKRIELAVSREKAIGFLLPNVEKQFQVAMDILVKISEAREISGLNDARKNDERSLALNNTNWDSLYGSGASKVMADPAARTRVVKFVENMTNLFGVLPKEKQEQIVEAAKKKQDIVVNKNE